jgi:hypothetical protein
MQAEAAVEDGPLLHQILSVVLVEEERALQILVDQLQQQLEPQILEAEAEDLE